jgi:hypothetical protein
LAGDPPIPNAAVESQLKATLAEFQSEVAACVSAANNHDAAGLSSTETQLSATWGVALAGLQRSYTALH